ncbi:hypothetical protein LOC67_23460 [Stieleria sp. JC731]|uniref:hypothetical protein n=1 Tax=Pirellulaceae TaxID=2691357 RepID=UPI001E42C0F3|nr:hypothetical protein [Stieleria sp. JC731]MCC9603518.1 hypothetical protein [Stieleria sp. JC731]
MATYTGDVADATFTTGSVIFGNLLYGGYNSFASKTYEFTLVFDASAGLSESDSISSAAATITPALDPPAQDNVYRIYGHKVASESAPATSGEYTTALSNLTTAYVDWSPTGLVVGTPITTDDLSPIIEELAAQSGFDGTFTLIFTRLSGSYNQFYSANNTTDKPSIDITVAAAGAIDADSSQMLMQASQATVAAAAIIANSAQLAMEAETGSIQSIIQGSDCQILMQSESAVIGYPLIEAESAVMLMQASSPNSYPSLVPNDTAMLMQASSASSYAAISATNSQMVLEASSVTIVSTAAIVSPQRGLFFTSRGLFIE